MSSSASPQLGSTVLVTEVRYEVQKKSTIFSSQFHPHSWVDSEGQKMPQLDMSLPPGWQWLGDWRSDGDNYWEYSTRWKGGSYASSESVLDTVRRMRWTRQRMKHNVSNQELQEIQKLGKIIKISSKDTTNIGMVKFYKGLQDTLDTASHATKKPVVLLLGGSGAGKSSLVNAVFGKPLAEIGEGKPITQNYTKFSGADSPVIIYDSKGIEHGTAEKGFVTDTKRFFSKLRAEHGLESQVHVVWYVIDLTQARFQPFEANFCRKHLEGIPIIFVFNKADCVSAEVREEMIRTVREFNLPNCFDIFATVADCKNYDSHECPECSSTKIRKRLCEGTCTVLCKECKKKTLLSKTSGIEDLSSSTLSCLPDLIRDTFCASQAASVLDLQAGVKKIISQHAEGAKFTRQESIDQQLSQMVEQLTKHYGLDMVSDMVCKSVMGRFQFFFRNQHRYKKVFMMLGDWFKKTNQAQAFVVLSGLEICNVLISLRRSLISVAVGEFEKKRAQSARDVDGKDNTAEKSNGTSAVTLIQELDSWKIEKIISNMQIEMDSESVHEMSVRLKKFGSVDRYLKEVTIDGTRSYNDIDYVIVEEKNIDDDDDDNDDDYVPIHNYQRQQVSKMKANEVSSSQASSATSEPSSRSPDATESNQ